jgi:hypothetical protein
VKFQASIQVEFSHGHLHVNFVDFALSEEPRLCGHSLIERGEYTGVQSRLLTFALGISVKERWIR